jgi:hypothetical protein
MGFLNSVQYEKGLPEMNSICGYLEKAADFCRKPGMWFASEVWDGGKKIEIIQDTEELDLAVKKTSNRSNNPLLKVVRIIVGIVLGIPGAIVGGILMALAYISEEVRLKHKVSNLKEEMSPEDHEKLMDFMKSRQQREKSGNAAADGCCAAFIVALSCLSCCAAASGSGRHHRSYHRGHRW